MDPTVDPWPGTDESLVALQERLAERARREPLWEPGTGLSPGERHEASTEAARTPIPLQSARRLAREERHRAGAG